MNVIIQHYTYIYIYIYIQKIYLNVIYVWINFVESPLFMLNWREREREIIKNHVKTLLGDAYKVVHTTLIILK